VDGYYGLTLLGHIRRNTIDGKYYTKGRLVKYHTDREDDLYFFKQMKYKISIFGKGSETYVFPISEEQKQKFVDMNIENSSLSLDDVLPVLSIEYLSDGEISFLGTYADPELYQIQVEDENGEVVWESSESFYPDDNDFQCVYDDDNFLLVEDYSKGTFFTYELELDEDFNPELINLIVKEIGERVELLTGITYNGNDIEENKDFGDTWSKGIYYHLV